MSLNALGRSLRYEEMRVRTPDGLDIAVQDWQVPGAQSEAEILFIHGFSQAHGAFLKQVTSSLTRRFRLVTFDLRGHGDSSKPDDAHYYTEAQRWAGEVRAVIDQAGLKRPVLVPWSYGGRVALDYLRAFGDRDISGLVMVNATARSSPDVLGSSIGVLKQMTNSDELIALAGTRALLDACVAAPLSPEELEYMLAYNAKVPARIRGHLAGRPADYEATLKSLLVPVLVVHGRRDCVNTLAMASYVTEQIHHAELKFYEEAAHMPFWESADRFNQDLEEFMIRAGRSACHSTP
jgi:pimeloyl-ACP methyl ester carboxylesterase